MASRSNFLVVGAIDFGTSYSGFAYSFTNDPHKVFTNTWHASARLTSNKTPTCILFDTDKKFSAFGYEAEDAFGNYFLDKKQNEWYFFTGYKMALYEQLRVDNYMLYGDVQGRKFPLLMLVTETIRYLKDQLIKTCKGNINGLQDTDIQWILTVPAIWSDSAKSFMRKAAENAGIPGYRLNICLEPEAAAIYCKTVPSYVSSEGESVAKVESFKEGDSYLLLDACGGTIDIIAHYVEGNGSLKEIHRASGGNWGGECVDAAFIDFLTDIVGKNTMKQFCRTDILDSIELMRDFESRKKTTYKQVDLAKLYFRIPFNLQNNMRSKATSLLMKSKGDVKIEGDKLVLSSGILMNFFYSSKAAIVEYLERLFSTKSLQGVNTVMMVGGYSESVALQEYIKASFGDKTIIIPTNPGLAILKGAVLYGHDPSVIAERRCRYTYGIVCEKNFDESKHKASTKYTNDIGEVMARYCFDIHVTVGRPVKTGEFQSEKSLVPSHTYQKSGIISLYICPRENPVYVTEDDCVKIGELEVDISDLSGPREDRAILVSLCFSGTEITIRARKKATGEILMAKIKYDF